MARKEIVWTAVADNRHEAFIGKARVGVVTRPRRGARDWIIGTFLPGAWVNTERFAELADAEAYVEFVVDAWFEEVSHHG